VEGFQSARKEEIFVGGTSFERLQSFFFFPSSILPASHKPLGKSKKASLHTPHFVVNALHKSGGGRFSFISK